MTLRRLSPAVLAVLAVSASTPGCGSEAEQAPETDDARTTQGPAPTTGAPPGEADQEEPEVEGRPPVEKPPRGEAGPTEGPRSDPRVTELEREAAATVRAYVRALNSRDGERVCSLLAPGAIDQVDLPLERRDCAASLDASIGFGDPRGLAVWEGAEVLELAAVRTDGSEATVVATVLTRFADRPEPSIEDDVIHLTRDAGEWVLAKPSATLHRAVGVADVPPIVLSPPRERS